MQYGTCETIDVFQHLRDLELSDSIRYAYIRQARITQRGGIGRSNLNILKLKQGTKKKYIKKNLTV